MGEDGPGPSIHTRMSRALPTLTRSERRAAMVLLSRYPEVGLESITGFADAAKVSPATIQRLIAKIGIESYPEFRQQLRAELAARQSGPLSLTRPLADGDAMIPSFRAGALAAVDRTLDAIDPAELAAVVDLLVDAKRGVYLGGGTFTYPLAEHLDFHLRKMRSGVVLLDRDMARRNDRMLDIRRGDVVILFDIRRYQPEIALTARFAAERRAKVVLFTDEWMSEVAAIAAHCFRARVEAATPWDTLLGLAALVELVAGATDARIWPAFRRRLEALDRLRDGTFVPDWQRGRPAE